MNQFPLSSNIEIRAQSISVELWMIDGWPIPKHFFLLILNCITQFDSIELIDRSSWFIDCHHRFTLINEKKPVSLIHKFEYSSGISRHVKWVSRCVDQSTERRFGNGFNPSALMGRTGWWELTFWLAVALTTLAFSLCDTVRTDSEISLSGTRLLFPVASFTIPKQETSTLIQFPSRWNQSRNYFLKCTK